MKYTHQVYIVAMTVLLSSALLEQAVGEERDKEPIKKPMSHLLNVDSTAVLQRPSLNDGPPAAGKWVKVTPPEYAGTDVFHVVYLPKRWKKSGEVIPIIFEYTGNYHPQSGSTGEPEDASLGFYLSGGEYIWVSLPYISNDHKDNAVTWWGDEKATVQYAKLNVPRIIEEFGADPDAVFLCGFSRGAIGVNYIGLHDDEIAKLWTAFISHDHFDGVKAWGFPGGSPLRKYREGAVTRLKRVGNRPYLVSHNGVGYGAKAFIESTLSETDNFEFLYPNTREILGDFPNEIAKTGHTDRWALKPSDARTTTWAWMNGVVQESKDE